RPHSTFGRRRWGNRRRWGGDGLRRSRSVPAEERGARLTAGQTEPRQRHKDGECHPRVPALRRSSVNGRHGDVPPSAKYSADNRLPTYEPGGGGFTRGGNQ